MIRESEVTVVVPCYTEARWDALCLGLKSALAQEPAPSAVVVAVDGNESLYQRLRNWHADVQVVLNTERPGASSTRNAGAAIAETPFIAFLDDDAQARAGWLANLLEPFVDPEVVGTGGFVAPSWGVAEPRWFPAEFGWVVGVSFRGMPETRTQVRNVWSENMAVRRNVFQRIGGFQAEFGKVGNVARPEDTDLCIRMGKDAPTAKWVYVPEAIVDHSVGPERARFSYFIHRSFSEGRGKVELARRNDGRSELGDESRYLTRTLPSGVGRYVWRAATTRDSKELLRAGALGAGLAAAGVGATSALLRRGQ